MKFAAVSLALLGATAVHGLATPAAFNAVQARQVEVTGGVNGIDYLVDEVKGLIDSLTDLSTKTIGALSGAVENALGTANTLIDTVSADVSIDKRQEVNVDVNLQATIARLNAFIDQLQTAAVNLTGAALAAANKLINQVQAVVTSLNVQVTANK